MKPSFWKQPQWPILPITLLAWVFHSVVFAAPEEPTKMAKFMTGCWQEGTDLIYELKPDGTCTATFDPARKPKGRNLPPTPADATACVLIGEFRALRDRGVHIYWKELSIERKAKDGAGSHSKEPLEGWSETYFVLDADASEVKLTNTEPWTPQETAATIESRSGEAFDAMVENDRDVKKGTKVWKRVASQP